MTIEVNKLSKTYHSQKAVNEISFSISKGEIVGFLGPNGAGKSTTMKMLTTYLLPSSGTALVSGFDILENSLEVRRQIGYLPENNPLYYDMYIKEYLHFVAGITQYQGNTKDRIKELISLTGLEIEQHKKIGMLSKGYKQRVGLAQALLHNPKVLILDEPTTGLDPNQILEIRNVIREAGKDKTVLFSSHILQEVEAICSRVIIINAGNLVADFPTSEIQQQFGSNGRIKIVFQNSMDVNKIKSIKGIISVEKIEEVYHLQVQKDVEIRPDLFTMASEINNPIFELNYESPRLENIFRDLTNN